MPARERGHYGTDTCFDGRRISGRVQAHKVGLVIDVVALVTSSDGSAVAEIVLGRRDDLVPGEVADTARSALQASHDGGRIARGDARVLRVAFVGPAPAIVANHGQRRRECPLESGGSHLQCGCRANLTQQVRIIRRTEANVVRKDRCAIDVAVTVHGIRSPDDRNRRQAGRRLHRGIVEGVGGCKPIAGGGPLVAVRR